MLTKEERDGARQAFAEQPRAIDAPPMIVAFMERTASAWLIAALDSLDEMEQGFEALRQSEERFRHEAARLDRRRTIGERVADAETMAEVKRWRFDRDVLNREHRARWKECEDRWSAMAANAHERAQTAENALAERAKDFSAFVEERTPKFSWRRWLLGWLR